MLGGSPWIVSKRQKTGVPFQIKLMDIPMQIGHPGIETWSLV